MMNSPLKVLGICLAAGLMTAFAFENAHSENSLHMHIDNTSKETVYYETGVGIDDPPETIAAGEESEGIKAPHQSGGGDGQMTYTNSQNPAEATCSFTLGFGYEFNDVTEKCDKKTFNISEKGCTLVKKGNCSGAGDCDCKFTLSIP